jgi:hypothetical protein
MFDFFYCWKWREIRSSVALDVQVNKVGNTALIKQLLLKEETFKTLHVNILGHVVVSVI